MCDRIAAAFSEEGKKIISVLWCTHYYRGILLRQKMLKNRKYILFRFKKTTQVSLLHGEEFLYREGYRSKDRMQLYKPFILLIQIHFSFHYCTTGVTAHASIWFSAVANIIRT